MAASTHAAAETLFCKAELYGKVEFADICCKVDLFVVFSFKIFASFCLFPMHSIAERFLATYAKCIHGT